MTATEGEVRFQPASDDSLLLYLAPEITLSAHRTLVKLLRLLQEEPVEGVRNLHPGYCSLLVKFDALSLRHEQIEGTMRQYLTRLPEIELPEPRAVALPVCYCNLCGPDLHAVSDLHQMEPEQVIEIHAAVSYLVYFLGFVPGFAYLGDVDPRLAMPRLKTPRRIVPAGSVGITGAQCAVYPLPTPGGWHLIGRTPLTLFHPGEREMSLLAIGDRVRFAPVTHDEFSRVPAGSSAPNNGHGMRAPQ